MFKEEFWRRQESQCTRKNGLITGWVENAVYDSRRTILVLRWSNFSFKCECYQNKNENHESRRTSSTNKHDSIDEDLRVRYCTYSTYLLHIGNDGPTFRHLFICIVRLYKNLYLFWKCRSLQMAAIVHRKVFTADLFVYSRFFFLF